MTDQELLSMLQQRDSNAIHVLSQQYGAYCRSIAYNILANPQDAEECCNDVWMQVWQHIPPLIADLPIPGKLIAHIAGNDLHIIPFFIDEICL